MAYIKKIVIRVRFLTYESRCILKTALNIKNTGYIWKYFRKYQTLDIEFNACVNEEKTSLLSSMHVTFLTVKRDKRIRKIKYVLCSRQSLSSYCIAPSETRKVLD